MGGTSLWLKPQMAWPSAQHGTAGLKGCRPCRRPLTEETAKLGADGQNSGWVTGDKFRGYSNPFVLTLSQVDQFLPLKTKRYSAQAMRNRSQKNAEMLLLEPTKNKEKSCFKQGKPLRNVRLESPQATRQNP